MSLVSALLDWMWGRDSYLCQVLKHLPRAAPRISQRDSPRANHRQYRDNK